MPRNVSYTILSYNIKSTLTGFSRNGVLVDDKILYRRVINCKFCGRRLVGHQEIRKLNNTICRFIKVAGLSQNESLFRGYVRRRYGSNPIEYISLLTELVKKDVIITY